MAPHHSEMGDHGARRRFGGAAPQFQGGVVSDTDSLFRVWATDVTDLGSMAAWFRAPLALTESAQKAVSEFDPVNDTVTPECTPKGMPIIMFQPPPMEFVDQGDTIPLPDGGVRHGSHHPHDRPGKPGSTAEDACRVLDRSLGGQDARRRDQRSQRSVSECARRAASSSADFVERFTPTADGSRLDYTLTITDPYSLTAPAA